MFQNLRDEMAKLDENFRKNYFEVKDVPSVLFQYTSIDGLKGILEKRKWWATHSHYLNDGKEIIYADELMSKILESRASKNSFMKVIYEEVLGKSYGLSSVLSAWDDDML